MKRRRQFVPVVSELTAFAGFRFPPEVIVLAVRWYLRFGLSYRDLEELLAERGIEVDHVTLFRWVQRFTPLLVEAARPCRHAVGFRWFVDETYVKVSGRWRYVYRAVDEQGQVIDICDRTSECSVTNFTVTSFPEITETPENTFLMEVRQNQQMNYLELGRYIQHLKESGFDIVRLQVQYYKKFTVPLFPLTIALISVPFGFLVGNRGAMAGVGVSIGLAMTYLGIDTLFEQMGNVGYLRPDVAAWAPDTLFSLAGLYLILRMRS